ncbi:MAG: hypothetical protein RLZZ312_445 [Bacteroidota bacterium]|jgi:hypothetical protein
MKSEVKANRSYFQFGVFYGVIMILFAVVIYVVDIDIIQDRAFAAGNSILGYLVLPILFIYLGCVNFKKNNYEYISFTECLKVGVGIIFLGAIIFGAFNVVFYYLFPDNLENILRQTRQMMVLQTPKLTTEQINMGVSMSRKFAAPQYSFPLTMVIFTFLGFLYSLFVGLIVKKDNPAGI